MACTNDKTRPSPESSKAFTLIELMVVIFIIGIVIALVVGVGRYVYDEARRKETEATLIIVVSAIEKFKDLAGEYPYDGQLGPQHPPGSATGLLYQFLVNPDPGGDPPPLLSLSDDQKSQIKDACSKIMLTLPSDVLAASGSVSLADAFGNELRYDRDGGFGGRPVVISAGPDKSFDADDDNIRSDRL